jgi:hypothetical protein
MTAVCAASCLLVGGLALSQSTRTGSTSGLTFRDIAYTSRPVNVTKPKITGVAKKGKTLKASHGTWKNNPTSYTYHWERCNHSGGSCTRIHGSTGNAASHTLKLTAADVGHTIRVKVIASNSAGPSKPAKSGHTAVVKS